MNLALNARDAMPAGGRLDIATANVEPAAGGAAGRRPAPALRAARVSDTGTGMSPEVQAHIFEPFFTTKEVGQGTGLGLATVYGIVSQTRRPHRGQQRARAGHDLPRLPALRREEAGRAAEAARPRRSRAARASETVLLVEDEGAVRDLIAEVLRRRGYRVLEAAERRRGARHRAPARRADPPAGHRRGDAGHDRARAGALPARTSGPACGCCSSPATATSGPSRGRRAGPGGLPAEALHPGRRWPGRSGEVLDAPAPARPGPRPAGPAAAPGPGRPATRPPARCPGRPDSALPPADSACGRPVRALSLARLWISTGVRS